MRRPLSDYGWKFKESGRWTHPEHGVIVIDFGRSGWVWWPKEPGHPVGLFPSLNAAIRHVAGEAAA